MGYLCNIEFTTTTFIGNRDDNRSSYGSVETQAAAVGTGCRTGAAKPTAGLRCGLPGAPDARLRNRRTDTDRHDMRMSRRFGFSGVVAMTGANLPGTGRGRPGRRAENTGRGAIGAEV